MNESEFLASYRPESYERLSVTVDLVLFTIRDETLQVLLTRRKEHPFLGRLALPGVFVRPDETLDASAERALSQKTGLHDIYFEQLYTWGDTERDPRMRVISVSYCALVPWESISLPDGDAAFFPASELAASQELAFDHARIIGYGIERIRNKVNYTDIAFSLVGEEFTLPELQKVYEILLGMPLYKANFRRKIADKLLETDKMTSGAAHRPSRIYRKKV